MESNIFNKAIKAFTILECIYRLVESGEYCSNSIKAVLGVAIKKETPTEESEEDAGADRKHDGN